MIQKKDLVEIVGERNVIDSPDVLQKYGKDHSFVLGAAPQYVVIPHNAKEVQSIVLAARTTSTPLIPLSSGEPHFKGDTLPTIGGIVLDLSSMNNIILIQRKARVALVEPGVTFAQLQPELNKQGLKLPTPLCPRKTKSVLASVIEREPTIIPKYHVDNSEPLLCAEIVFGTGDVFKTGGAAGPGTIQDQWQAGRYQEWAAGPGQVGFTRLIQGWQGSIGAATWASVRCELLPDIRKLLFFKSGQIENLIGFIYQLLRLKLGDECLLLNNLDLASVLSNDSNTVSVARKLPPWTLLLGIGGYGTFAEDRISYQENDIIALAQQFGLAPEHSLYGISDLDALAQLDNVSSETYWKLKNKGESFDIFFITTMDKVPGFISVMNRLCNEHQYPTTDMGIYVQPIQQGRSCHCEFNLTCNADDAAEMAIVRKLFADASETLMKEGAFFSRPYGPWAAMAFNRDAASKEAVKKVKNIFDPDEIFNPGKLF